MGYQIKSGNKWLNFRLKLDYKGLFDLFYLGSKGHYFYQYIIRAKEKAQPTKWGIIIVALNLNNSNITQLLYIIETIIAE